MKHLTKFLFLFTSISMFSQSPWTQKEGKFYTQLSFTSISNYNRLFGSPDYDTERKTTDNTIQFYGEYGLSNKTTLTVNLPLKLVKTGELNQAFFITPPLNEGSESTLGNIELGIKRQFSKKNWIISGQISVEVNTSSFNVASGIRTGYNAWSFTPLFLAGKSFGKTYLQTFVGANIRTNNYSSNFKTGGELGHKITKNVWLIGFIDIVKSFKNKADFSSELNPITFLPRNGLYVNNQEYGAFGLKGIGEFTNNFGITASFGGAFFGNNVAKAPALSFGVYHKF